MKEGTTTTTKTKDVWDCDRCGSVGQMLPCPRGGCEAKIIGQKEIVTTTTYRKFSEQEEIEVNTERGTYYYDPKQR